LIKKISLKFLILFSIFTLISNSSFARDPAKIKDGVLVSTSNNMTLYVFDKDLEGSGKSECNDPCAKNWPPFSLTEKEKSHGHGRFKTITRNEGNGGFFFVFEKWIKLEKGDIVNRSSKLA
jgi:predicted lipoprotein with Yx(FWY)xxD motif